LLPAKAVSQVSACLQLLDFNTSIRTWNSVHFLGHFLMVAIILVSLVNPPRKPRKKETAAADKEDKTGQGVPAIQAGTYAVYGTDLLTPCPVYLRAVIILVSQMKLPGGLASRCLYMGSTTRPGWPCLHLITYLSLQEANFPVHCIQVYVLSISLANPLRLLQLPNSVTTQTVP
jgi:hypothetical protein